MTTPSTTSPDPVPSRALRASLWAAAVLWGSLGLGCATHKGYAPVNGLRMYYEIHGDPGDPRPPLVLLHGGGSTIGTSFGSILPALARGRRVIALERQGHGHSADIDRPFTFAQSAEDTLALLRQLGVVRADFLGYSNGGHVAIEIALTHPEVVRKLIIESAMFDREGTDPAFWESFDHARIEDMPRELREAYLQVAPHPEDLPTFFAKSVTQMKEFKGWRPEQIHSIQAPTLVLVGDRDLVRPEHAVTMARLLPHGQLAIVPGADHLAITRPPSWVSTLMTAFLDSPMP
jgi:pimeloyl-ACP methyl ester carboxylesterase